MYFSLVIEIGLLNDQFIGTGATLLSFQPCKYFIAHYVCEQNAFKHGGKAFNFIAEVSFKIILLLETTCT